MSDAPDEQPAEGEQAPDVPTQDEVRRRFREALDRKNNASRTSEEHADSKGVGPAVNNTVTRREFRRKSG